MSYSIINKSLSSVIANFKAQFVPVKDKYAKLTFNGDIACPGDHEYRAFVNGVLTSIPEEILLNVPFYRILKPIDQVKAGDIIFTCAAKKKKDGTVDPEGSFTYRLVNEVKDGKICTSSFGGSNSTITPVADFFMGQKTVYVLINLFSGIADTTTGAATAFNPMMLALLDKDGDSSIKDMLPFMLMQQGGAAGFNPMMLLALKDGGSTKDLLPLLMMQQGGFGAPAAGGINPMMLLALKDGDSDLSDLLLLQAVSGQSGFDFSKIFGGTPVAAAAAAPATEA